ncbi:MAG: type II toxin-antitoxin system VapC family toxin [Acidobacteriota bacterium]
MPVTFDTCILISYHPTLLPAKHLLSAVVVQELIAGAVDASQAKTWAATAREFDKEQRLLVPDTEDWIEAGRILNALLRGLKARNRGRTPKLPHDQKQRIIRDVLIARCVRRAGATLVTDNLKDFAMISRFCNVTVKSGRQFFR